MCLSSEFFLERGKAIRQYALRGEVELDSFLEEHGLSEEDLFRAGLLKEKLIRSTADLSDYAVSETGRHYLREVRRYQLRMIKPKKREELLARIRQTTK